MADPLREEIDRNNDTQRTAVAGQTALPDLQDLHGIRQIVAGRIEEAMPQARTNHRAQHGVDQERVDPRGWQLLFLPHPLHNLVAYRKS